MAGGDAQTCVILKAGPGITNLSPLARETRDFLVYLIKKRDKFVANS